MMATTVLQPGDVVRYQWESHHDAQYAGVWHYSEVVAEVVRVGKKRITIRCYFDGYQNPPESGVRVVSRDKVRLMP